MTNAPQPVVASSPATVAAVPPGAASAAAVVPAPPGDVSPPPTASAAPAEPPPAISIPGDGPAPEAVPIAGSEYVRGRTTILVKAPIQRVREAVFDFGHYAEFMPHYRGSRLLGRTPTGARDVYMEVEAMHGVVRMWAEIEVAKPVVQADGTELIDIRFIKGNVKNFSGAWRLRKIDDVSTQLALEVFLEPGIPLPTALINRENLVGSRDGVQAMRGHAEQPKK